MSQTSLAESYFNYANTLIQLGQLHSAIENYDRAITINPHFVDAYVNRGNALVELRRLEEAIESYGVAISLDPHFILAYANRALALVELHQLDAAVASYETAMIINPHFEYLLGSLLHTKMKLCDWAGAEENIAELVKRIEHNQKTSIGFHFLSLTTSLSIQKKASEIFSKDKYPPNHSLGYIPKKSSVGKIRLGYFSADFRIHAVSILLAEVFELHDKNKFEIIAFSFGQNTDDPMRQRLQIAFDQFIDVRDKTDKEVAVLARELGVDIAIDLGGNTGNSRTSIFAYRAAPIQVSYIGYLGTMGADYFDYLIADKTIIPKESQQHYVEKIVYLPSYQANDSKRTISEKIFTKQELGLPSEGFIFCCFNFNYKITPTTFDGWMRILQAVEGSVLFLYSDNATAEHNLKKEAALRGVDSNRIIFGGRLAPSEYLARYRVADLFLDTFPYNAGTTASDALWVGLPILTLIGETFSSRVAASLLTAIELPELITYTQEEYEALAIELAMNPTKLHTIKAKLAKNRFTTRLFNSTLFTKHIEDAYTQMVERYRADLAPDHLYVE